MIQMAGWKITIFNREIHSFLKALFFHLPLVSFNQRGPHSYRTPLGPVVTVAWTFAVSTRLAQFNSVSMDGMASTPCVFFRPFQRDFWLRDPLSLKAVKDVIEVDPKKKFIGCLAVNQKSKRFYPEQNANFLHGTWTSFFIFLVFFWLCPTKFSLNYGLSAVSFFVVSFPGFY